MEFWQIFIWIFVGIMFIYEQFPFQDWTAISGEEDQDGGERKKERKKEGFLREEEESKLMN